MIKNSDDIYDNRTNSMVQKITISAIRRHLKHVKIVAHLKLNQNGFKN